VQLIYFYYYAYPPCLGHSGFSNIHRTREAENSDSTGRRVRPETIWPHIIRFRCIVVEVELSVSLYFTVILLLFISLLTLDAFANYVARFDKWVIVQVCD
jgi:hypothetical protein